MKYASVSIAKPGQQQINEDAAIAGVGRIAVSDGAGGGGVYADEWAQYLLKNLPKEPITSFRQLDGWIDSIWETFYKEYEQVAKGAGSVVLNKFYEEGSFATLAAAWVTDEGLWKWMTYGDSVVFHYSRQTGELRHSPIHLVDFNNPPYLISLNDKLVESVFNAGEWQTDADDILFCASDALSHYIIMVYELSRVDEFKDEISEALRAGTKNAALIVRAAIDYGKGKDFYVEVMQKLVEYMDSETSFRDYMEDKLKRRLLSLDDYSYAMIDLSQGESSSSSSATPQTGTDNHTD